MAANNDTPKAMDVLHPAQTAQPTTSKPVIVSNRPMIAEDPMIAKAVSAIDIEQPAGAPPLREQPPLADTATRREKTLTSPKTDDAAVPTDNLSEPPPTPDDAQSLEKPPLSKETSDIAMQNESAVAGTMSGAHEVNRRDEAGPKDALSDSVVAIDGEEISGQAIDDAEEKRRLELEAMIAQGRYTAPIGQVAKRRQRTVIVTLFTILVMIVALDILLDVGILDISFLPHTSFFR